MPMPCPQPCPLRTRMLAVAVEPAGGPPGAVVAVDGLGTPGPRHAVVGVADVAERALAAAGGEAAGVAPTVVPLPPEVVEGAPRAAASGTVAVAPQRDVEGEDGVGR